jgi:putative PIN family toxin of toxin-antitoxin system
VLKVVFDTNVYISAFITKGGQAELAYLSAVEKSVELYTSIPILTELARKLREKFAWEDDKIAAAVRHISEAAVVVKPRRKLVVLRDDPDNRILECAGASGAELIVTGDRHLLVLKEFEGSRIVKLAEFLREAK